MNPIHVPLWGHILARVPLERLAECTPFLGPRELFSSYITNSYEHYAHSCDNLTEWGIMCLCVSVYFNFSVFFYMMFVLMIIDSCVMHSVSRVCVLIIK